MIRCMGIDPGLASTGIAIIESQDQQVRLVTAATIKTQSTEIISTRLAHIYDTCLAYMREHTVSSIALERLYFSRNISSALPVSEAVGVIRLAAVHAGLSIAEFSPNEVKKCIVGIGKAEKQQVQHMVSILLGNSWQTSSSHASDAAALALTQLFLVRGGIYD